MSSRSRLALLLAYGTSRCSRSSNYLYDLKLKRVEAAAKELDETRKVARVAVEEAGKAKFWATAAFIIAGGAMLAAMAAAFIAFLALRRYGFQPPW